MHVAHSPVLSYFSYYKGLLLHLQGKESSEPQCKARQILQGAECMNAVPTMDHEYAEWSLPREAERVLHSLALNWADVVDAKQLELIPLKGAMTNEVFQCIWQTRKGRQPRTVLVRIYGEGVDLFFNREDEIGTFECMSRLGQGPRLLGRFPNGRVEEFLHARTLSAPDLRDLKTSAQIAAKLSEFHQLDVPGPREPLLWKRLRDWLRTALALCPKDVLEKALSRPNQTIGFCHNDLQYGNIMIDEEDKSVTIIDHVNDIDFDYMEYARQRFQQYHFCKPLLLNT